MTALGARIPPVKPERIDYPRVALISAGHLMNDTYGSLLSSLMPYLVLQGSISTTVAGLVTLVYLIDSSLLQPVFGVLADQTGRRIFVVLGPIWVGIGAALAGWAGGAAVLLGLAAFSGIGTAAFHPQAASMVNLLSPRSKGRMMAFFSMGGNIGFAFGPVLAAGIALVGLHWSPLVLIPGLALTVLLALFTPRVVRTHESVDFGGVWEVIAARWRPLLLIVSVIAVRSGVQFALVILLPLYYHAQGLPPQLGSILAFVLSLSGAFGGVLGGHLSDLYGRKVVVVASLLVAAPLIFVSLLSTGPLVWPLVALSGAALLASNSVTVVQGQELMPHSTAVASGFTLGLAFGLSGVFTTSLTALSDHAGVTAAIFMVPFLALVAAGLGSLVQETPLRMARPAQARIKPG